MKAKLISLGIVALVGILVGFTVAKQRQQAARKRVGYTIEWNRYGKDFNGNFVIVEREVRAVPSRGGYVSRKFGVAANFPNAVYFSEPDRGTFTVKETEKKLIYTGGSNTAQSLAVMPKMKELRADKNFSRVENILGYEAAVMHYPDSNDENGYSEIWYAPQLNGDLIKLLIVQNRETQIILEPVSIKEGEPGAKDLAHEEYSEDRTEYQKLHPTTH